MKVLLVDDTKTLLSLVQVYLMGWGIEFVVATDGAQGLAKARSEKPDLVITDVRMPQMNGFELCAAIRGDRTLATVPILLLTSLNDDASRRQGKLVGASAFLSKPIAVAALRSTVAELLHIEEPKR